MFRVSVKTRACLSVAVGGLLVASWLPSAANAEDATLAELRLLKRQIKLLEDRVARQDQAQKETRTRERQLERRITTVSHGPAPGSSHAPLGDLNFGHGAIPTFPQGDGRPPVRTGALGTSTGSPSAEKHWYERLSVRGYTQFRMNSFLSGDRELVRLPGDRSVGKDQNFFLRRVRLIVSGDVSDHLYLYLQPDFASSLSGVSGTGNATTFNFAQLRDAYADIYFDSKKEFRIRAGQSKIPYSFENMQSSQNRLALDRNDATNTCCRDERDIGAFFYYTPEHLRPVFRDLVKNNLKGSGDYGMFALGVYNGQGANRPELNNELHVVSRFTYPYTFQNGQIVEAGVNGYVGRFVPGSLSAIGTTPVTPVLVGDRKGIRDERVGVHAVLYPQPFGIQAEYNWGRGPQLNTPQTAIEARSLEGGYIQGSYKYDDKLWHTGVWFPFVKYQYYNGASKFETNAPVNKVRDIEFGIEYQPRPELELTVTYAKLHRTNLFVAPYQMYRADIFRSQLQWNY